MTQAVLSAGELTNISSHPHAIKLYLAVLNPDTVFAARLNDADIAQGDMAITYDTVTTGAWGDIVAGMTLMVGSTAAGEDLGRVRIRSATDTVINVAEQSDVQWTDDAYLTVVNNYEYWVKFSRAVESGGTVTHYQDYDGGFQGANQPPVPIMGPPACAFIGTAPATASVDFVGEDSYLITGSTIDTYSWVFPSGTPSTAATAGTTASPHTVTWNTPGVYWVSLEIVDDDGQTATGRRPVFIFDRTGSDSPFSDFEITKWVGDWEAGGWQLGIRVFDDAPITTFPEGAMVVLFAEEFWDGTQSEIGGYDGRHNIKFVGYIERETTQEQYAADGRRYVEFAASTVHEIMKDRENYPQTLQTCTTSTGWPYVTDLTVRKAAYHQLKWASTIFEICDVYLPTSTLSVASFDFPLASLYRQVDDYLSSAVFAHACCDKQGALWLREDPQYLSTTDRTGLVTVLDITDHQRTQITIPHQQRGITRHVELQGIYYNAGLSIPVISQAPGNAPRQDGRGTTITGLVVGNQTTTNALAGVVLAERNNLWTGIDFKLSGNHSYIDIAQPAYIQHDLTAAGNKRDLVWTDEKFIVRNIGFSYDARYATLQTDIMADRENDPLSGVTGVYPVEPPEEVVPDPEPPPWDPIPVDPEVTGEYMCAFDDTNGFYWTANGGTNWTQRNTGLDTSTAFLCGAVKRGWQTMQGTTNPEDCILFGGGIGFLALTRDAGKTWTDILPTSSNITWVGDDPTLSGSLSIKAVDCPNDATDTIYAFGDSACDYGQCAVLLQSDDLGQTWDATAILSAGDPTDELRWIHPEAYYGAGGAGITSGNCVGCPQTRTVTNPENLFVDDGEAVMTYDVSYTGCSDVGWDIFSSDNYAIWDFGPGWKTAPSSVSWNGTWTNFYVHVEIAGTANYGGTGTFDGASAQVALYNGDWGGAKAANTRTGEPFGTGTAHANTKLDLDGIYGNSLYFWGLGAFTDNYPVRYMVVNLTIGAADVPMGATLTLKNASLYVKKRDEGIGTVTALGLAVDLEDASRIYVTYTDVGNGTWLATYDTDLAETRTYDLTTNHSVTTARPRCVWQPTVTDYGDIVLLYGTDGAGFVGYSDDAGATVSDVSGALGAVTQVYALAAKGDGAGQLASYVAFGDGGEVYSATTLGTWSLEGSAGVTPDYRGKSISVNQDSATTLLIGSGSAGATMIETAPAPWVSYTDVTGDYPTDGAVVMVEWVV